MKLEVDIDLIFHLAQQKMTDPSEANWAIGQVLVQNYAAFNYIAHKLVEAFNERHLYETGDQS